MSLRTHIKGIHVSMTDTGLGDLYVILCDDREQVEAILRNARKRPEMKLLCAFFEDHSYGEERTDKRITVTHYNNLGDIWKE